MRKIVLSFIVFSAIIIFVSCRHEEKMASKAAYSYSYAMANYDVDEAEKYATKETEDILRRARILVRNVGDDYIKSDTPANIEITKIEMTSDTSAIATYHKTTPIKDFSGTLELRKRNGKWLAHVPLQIREIDE